MADILIRGVEMPKEKNLWLCIKTDGTVYNIKPGGIGTAHAVGTAVPLPEGHGRLIDADAMERTMSETVQGDIRGYPYSDTQWDMAFRWIDHQPTIVPAEGG